MRKILITLLVGLSVSFPTNNVRALQQGASVLVRHQRGAPPLGVAPVGAMLSGSSAGSSSKSVVIGLDELTDSLDPARGFTTAYVFRAVYDTLVTFPDTGVRGIVPRLATTWSQSKNGLTFMFHLRKGVVFANGKPLQARDVVFSVRRLQNIKGNPSFLADSIQSVQAVDSETVRFTLKQRDPAFLVELANTAFSVTSADVVRAHGGSDGIDAAKTDSAEQYLNQHSAGTGAYILQSWTRQQRTVLVRNPRYWGKRPFFDRIVIANIPAAAARKDALEAGDIDVAFDLTPDQATILRHSSGIHVYRGPSEIIHYLVMNRDPAIGGPMANPRVELAVRYALDYAGFRKLWPGSVTPGTNLMVALPGAYGPSKAFKRNLKRARQLLSQAGYPHGFHTTMDYPDITYGGVAFSTNAEKIKADLAGVGIDVTLRPGDFSVTLAAYREGKQGFGYWLWGPNILDPSDLLSFVPGGTAATRANWKDSNADPSILRLRQQASSATSQKARLRVYAKIQDYLQRKGPFAPFNEPPAQTAYRSTIAGYVWHPAWQFDVSLLRRVT